MWHRVSICAVLVSFLAVCRAEFVPAFQQPERIRSFRSDIEVLPDGSIRIRETILVHGSGRRIRHGIFREFAARGDQPPLAFRVLDAQRNGKPERYSILPLAQAKRVFIGSPGDLIPPGDYTYTLVYQTPREILSQAERDRLYWEVTGTGWQFPIEHAEAYVHFPRFSTMRDVHAVAYTGTYGSTSCDCQVIVSPSGEVSVVTSRPLAPTEGLTIRVDWPSGLFGFGLKVRSFFGNLGSAFMENLALRPAVLGFLVLLLYYTVAWFFAGRPAPGAPAEVSGPPEGISAAAMRYIRQRFLDNKTFTAAVVSMGLHGALQVREDGDDYLLQRTHSDLHTLPAEDREIGKVLFAGEDSISVKLDQRRIRKSLEAFKACMQERYSKYLSLHSAFSVTGWAITVVSFGWSLICLQRQLQGNEADGVIVAGLCYFGALALLAKAWPDSWREWTNPISEFHGHASKPERPEIFPALALIVFLLFIIVAVGRMVGTPWATVLAALTAVNLLGAFLMSSPTREGRELLVRIEAFRRYLQHLAARAASEDEASAHAAFERYSAYALALDLESGWASALQQALGQELEKTVAYRPHWYSGERFDRFYFWPGGFGSAIGRTAVGGYTHAASTIGTGGTGGGVGGAGSGGGGNAGGGGFAGGGGGGGGW